MRALFPGATPQLLHERGSLTLLHVSFASVLALLVVAVVR